MFALDALTGVSALFAAFFLNERNDISVISVLLVILSVLGGILYAVFGLNAQYYGAAESAFMIPFPFPFHRTIKYA